jgi:hypothetical protein
MTIESEEEVEELLAPVHNKVVGGSTTGATTTMASVCGRGGTVHDGGLGPSMMLIRYFPKAVPLGSRLQNIVLGRGNDSKPATTRRADARRTLSSHRAPFLAFRPYSS